MANLGAATTLGEAVNPLDVFLPADALRLVGLNPDGFNSRTGPLRFSLTGAEFEQELVAVTLTINGARVPLGKITVGPDLLSADVTLANGRNDISLKTYDHVGRPLYFQKTVWAGSSSLQVQLVHPDGSPFLAAATVTANELGTAGVVATDGFATIVMHGFGEPSSQLP